MGEGELLAVTLARIEVDSNGCHVYIGAKTANGYGQVRRGGRNWLAHRWTYTQAFGPIPEGLDLDHLCRNRACCNPAHLEPVTRSVNLRRGLNGSKTQCPQGHEYTPENTRIDRNGWRKCRECERAHVRRQQERRRAS